MSLARLRYHWKGGAPWCSQGCPNVRVVLKLSSQPPLEASGPLLGREDPLLERAEAHLDPHKAGCSIDGQRVPGEGVEALAIKALSGFQAHSRHATLPLTPCRQHRGSFKLSDPSDFSAMSVWTVMGTFHGQNSSDHLAWATRSPL